MIHPLTIPYKSYQIKKHPELSDTFFGYSAVMRQLKEELELRNRVKKLVTQGHKIKIIIEPYGIRRLYSDELRCYDNPDHRYLSDTDFKLTVLESPFLRIIAKIIKFIAYLKELLSSCFKQIKKTNDERT